MPDLAVVAADVVYTGSTIERGTAGATITAGQAVYYDTSNENWALADADALASVTRVGIALHGASAGQPITVARPKGDIDLGVTITVGTVYVVSTTAGGIAPLSDLLSGDFVCILGVGTAADKLSMSIFESGVAVA